ncbi:MAG: amino acid substrate-binding protein, partial [Rhodoferax sp.]|nr:amino acid substrate-binding protein [Rhodoferax sp.]
MQFSKPGLLAIAAAMTLSCSLAQAQSKDPVRIGVPTALTGPYADLGDQAKRAITFAMDESNAAGGVDGRKIEAKFLDTQAKADLARQQGEKLALEGYRLLMGSIASGEALAMGPMLERWDALYISSINKANEITGASCSARMFRVNRLDASDAAVIKPWLETRKEAKWAIVAADTAWGRNSGGSFTGAAKANAREVVSEAYPPFGTNDFAPYIQAVA